MATKPRDMPAPIEGGVRVRSSGERADAKATSEKKPARGGQGEVQSERGEWGYIPPGCVVTSMAALRAIRWLLVVVLVANAVILLGQYLIYWAPRVEALVRTT